jgi:hypothetical protein
MKGRLASECREETKKCKVKTHPRKPNRPLLVVHIHQEEHDPTLKVPPNVVDDQSLSNVVDFDEGTAGGLHCFVAGGVDGDAAHVVGDGFFG